MNPLRTFYNRRNITPSYAAFFIGVEVNGYWDLEMHQDEPWQTTVAQFLRVCVFCETPPELLLPDDAFRAGQRTLLFPKDQYGHLHVASVLREAVGDVTAHADTIGWEEEALREWLTDEVSVGEMSMLALNDLCEYLNVDVSSVLTALWQGLGR